MKGWVAYYPAMTKENGEQDTYHWGKQPCRSTEPGFQLPSSRAKKDDKLQYYHIPITSWPIPYKTAISAKDMGPAAPIIDPYQICLNVFHEKWAQTDVSKEMRVPNPKGLKRLNTVIKLRCTVQCWGHRSLLNTVWKILGFFSTSWYYMNHQTSRSGGEAALQYTLQSLPS